LGKWRRCIGQLAPHQSLEVLATNILRMPVEWPYGDVTALFQIMHNKHHMKYCFTYWVVEYGVASTGSCHILYL
jgi:hypothetical protein